eukprot:2459458-Rhodomonas_salina.2
MRLHSTWVPSLWGKKRRKKEEKGLEKTEKVGKEKTRERKKEGGGQEQGRKEKKAGGGIEGGRGVKLLQQNEKGVAKILKGVLVLVLGLRVSERQASRV